MSIRIVCPGCRAVYTVADELRGKKARCRECQTLFPITVPDAAASERPAVQVVPVAEPPPADIPPAVPAPVVAAASAPPIVEVVEGPPAPRRSAPPPARRRPAEEDDYDDDPRPRKKRQKKSAGLAITLILLGGTIFAVLLVGGGVFVLVYYIHEATAEKPATTQKAAADAAEPPPFMFPNPGEDNEDDKAANDKTPREPEYILDPPIKESVGDKGPPPRTPTGELAPEVLDKVKRATVYIRVTMANGQMGTGSGFFGVEPGIVLTNAHVVGMMAHSAGKPKKLEIILNSGEGPDEKNLPGEVIDVDRVADLAVLRVKLDKQPTPLEVKSALSLRETQPVYVFGFPFGETLGKNVTITNTTVSSLRKDQTTGVLTKVQVHGGMHPGNSGGPVVDAWGDVVGVSVAKFMVAGREAQIDFAVPGDYVQVILHGRLTDLTCGQPYRAGDQVKVPVTVRTLDPLKRIKKLAVEYWLGNPSKPRSASRSEPKAEPGDTTRQTLLLTAYKGGVARGELTLPLLPAGKAYWLQPTYVSGPGTKWALARTYTLPATVERQQTTLLRKPKPGDKHDLVLTQNSMLRFHGTIGDEHSATNSLEVRLTDATETVEPDGTSEVRRQYTALHASSRIDGKRWTHALQGIGTTINSLVAKVRLDARGRVVKNEIEPSPDSPPPMRNLLASLHERYGEPALEVLMPALPNKEVKPGEDWKDVRTLQVDTYLGQSETANLSLTYTYAGLRTQAGQTAAVLTVGGTVRTNASDHDNGRVNGTVVLDPATGQVTEADLTVQVELSVTFPNGQSASATVVQEMKLRPATAKTASKS